MTCARLILNAARRAADEDGFAAHAVCVQVGDELVSHHWDADVRRDVHSVAKGVCVLAAGIASDTGLLDVDAPVSRYLPGWTLGKGVQDVTTRHLLTMRSGVDLLWSETMLSDWPDLAREFLARPSSGRVFQYSDASYYTAMRVLAAAVRADVQEWLRPRLFDPLGIDDPRWERCSQGYVVGGSGLFLRAEELARIGQLIRDGGLWRGRRVVASGWTTAMGSDWVEHDASPDYARYSLAGWGGPGDAWRLHGAHGQLVIFRSDTVVTVTAHDHAGADRMARRVVEAMSR